MVKATFAGGPARNAKATLAGGCFWCTEAIFKKLKGVISVMPGYTGGTKPDPAYEDVCSGSTGHAEAVQIDFDPGVISYDTLLDVFFATHDPTTMNKQGADTGTQYRSAIFYHSQEQKKSAEIKVRRLEKERKFPSPVVTQITPFEKFYRAESGHRDFYNRNRNSFYCHLVIDPKIKKLLADFDPQTIA